jgi:hypothetical protein
MFTLKTEIFKKLLKKLKYLDKINEELIDSKDPDKTNMHFDD